MTDMLTDETRDIAIAGGDLKAGDSGEQHQALLMDTCKGEWKQSPTTGIGAVNYLENMNDGSLAREIQTQFTRDGMKVKNIRISDSIVEVEATYE